ncbi:MAG: peptide deformylase [Candidatus Omnitrophica bacterium]|nr:peptide deformylase [Candidatus Omnitrophota bacterium]
MILKVARLGHPALRRKASPVSRKLISSAGFQSFLKDLVETMHEYDGVGIAAPQVHLSLQVAAVEVNRNPRYPKAPRIPRLILINPRLKALSREKVLDWEGCLSVPGLRGRVPRWRSVEVQAYNAQGRAVRFRAGGFFARVIQHEWDHLQGRVYLDRMRDLKTLTHLEEYVRYWNVSGHAP